MYAIFQASLLDPDTGVFTWNNYASVFSTPFYRRCLVNSLFMSGLSTVFSVLIGVPFAFFTTRYRLPGATTLRTLATLPLILPTFIGAEAWLLLLGRNGIVTRQLAELGLHIPSIYGWQGVVLVFTLQFFPFVFLMVSAAINSVDRSLEEAARNLGASPWRVFRTVTLPVVTPAIASGALIVFCMSIENFGVPTIIGNDYKVLAEQAYSEFVSEMGGNPSMAGTLSTVLVVVTLVLTVLQKVWVERKNYAMSALRPPEVKTLSPLGKKLAWAFCAGIVFISLAPFAVVMVAAVTKTNGPVMYYGQFTLDNLLIALQVAPRPILNSFFLSTTATVIGMVFGLAVSYLVVRKGGVAGYVLDLAMMLPLVIAGSVLGIALAASYNKGPVVLTGTWMIIVLAYFIRKTPFSVKTTSALLHQIEVSVEEASISLGVPPFATFLKVVVPSMLPGVVAGAIIMWVTTLAELSSTIVLYYGPWSTMTVQVFQYIGSGDFGPASAYGAILIVSVLVPLFLLSKFLGRDLTTAL
ncbi:iron ABC transporter permease [Desulfovibrio sp. 86]|uniref:ABC transporter permease n=2 Tax=unclassified Desulfovibrio TaxID=2593640 RepID=UPI0015D18D86|nr:iron ABC transporter permease [Desulfovibrio sp. 86]